MKIRDDEAPNIIETIDKTAPKPKERVRFLYFLLVILLILLLGRSWQLQVIGGKKFRLHAEENRVAVTILAAPRGIIYDDKGKQLVENVASTDLILDPLKLPGHENEASLLDNLPNYTEISHEEIRQALQSARDSQQPTLLARAISHEEVIKLKGGLNELPGVSLVSSSVRNYLYPYSLSHLLGYTGLVNNEDLGGREDLLFTDYTGKIGIEKQYDKRLHGRHGALYVEVDVEQRPQKEVGVEEAVRGEDLCLAVDADLQEFIFNVLAERNSTGAVVAMDPQTGAVKAMVSYPSFDPNVFSQPIHKDSVGNFLKDDLEPLFNRAISGVYAPGSTIKPLLAASALEEGIINSGSIVLSTGGISVGQWYFPDWKEGGHGATNVVKAIAESVNTFFYVIAGGNDTYRGLGINKMVNYLESFSWGKETGIDIPTEAEGLLPTPEWKESTKQEQWYIGDTYHAGIGQGDVLVTPLQVAVATMSIANQGYVYEPRVIASCQSGRINTITQRVKERKRRLPISKGHLQTVRFGMRQAVLEGSAKRLSSLPVAVAGKTGTAQIGGTDDTHAWFTSFGPYENPELVITILLERGGEGDKNAVPVAEEIWSWWSDNNKK